MQPNPNFASSPLRDTVAKLAAFLHSDAGHRSAAELRRLPPAQPDQPAFFRIATGWLEPAGLLPAEHDGNARLAAESAWGTILRAMAHLVGLHSAAASLGRGLAEAGFSEPRLLRLLRSSDDTLSALVRVSAHQLAATGTRIDQAELAWLVCSDTSSAEARESARRRIATDFYRHLERSPATTAQPTGEL